MKYNDTNIENGSRYLQMLKCDNTLPNKTNFGRFEVRIFADNNRTECKYCGTTDHPSFLCRDKPARVVRCYNCNTMGHIARDCNNEPVVLSARKVVTLEIIVNNILLKRHDAIMGVMPRKSQDNKQNKKTHKYILTKLFTQTDIT